MAQTLIIGIDDFRELTGLGDAISETRLTAMIVAATDTYTRTILGTALTQALITKYNADDLSGAYQELYDSEHCSVKKMVIWQTFVHNMNSLLWTVGNGSISRGTPEQGQSADASDIANLKREKAAMLAQYENDVKKYLSQNQSDFSELSVNTPTYLQENTSRSGTSQGTTYTPTLKYNDL